MNKKATTKRRVASPKKVGDARADGLRVTQIKKDGSRTYYFYGPGLGNTGKRAAKRAAISKAPKKPKASLLGSGIVSGAASKISAHQKRTKARIAKTRK